MPYRWNETETKAPEWRGHSEWHAHANPPAHASHAEGAAPLATLTLWPNRSLAPKGFAAAILLLFTLGTIPVLSLLGSKLLWVIAAFTLSVLAALWIALQKSYRRGLGEAIHIWPDHLILTRTNPRGPDQIFEANPYWLRLTIRANGGPVEQYLTLKGGLKDPKREVELGAFLSPEERLQLRDDLAFVLGQLNP
ncbi:MAG: DUF2244 domain-containing protein [Paracoccaceae bacterium]